MLIIFYKINKYVLHFTISTKQYALRNTKILTAV